MRPTHVLLLAAITFSCLGTGEAAAQSCDKLIFERFCLGSDINALVRAQPDYVHQQSEGDRLALIYPEGRDFLYVLSFKGTIYKVVRRYEPATLLRYEELLDLLSAKYGRGDDQSRFPSYVRSQASRLGAIRRGDGLARQVWQLADKGVTVSLSWTREMGVSLAYSDDRLAGHPRSLDTGGL